MTNLTLVIDRIPYFNKYSAFIIGVLTNMTGGVIAQTIGFLCAPVIARLFTPEHFGIAALVASFAAIFRQTSCFGYSQAIILPKEDSEAVKIMGLSLIILISLCIVLTFGMVFTDLFSVVKPWSKNVGGWIFAVPISILLSGFMDIFSSMDVRKKQYGIIAKAQILEAIVSPGIKIGAGAVAGSSVFGIVASQLIAMVARVGVLLNNGKRAVFRDLFKIKRHDIYHIAKEYRDFPIYGVPAALLNGFSQSIVVIMLGYLFSPAVVGFYAMGAKLLNMPLNIIIVSMRRVYMQSVAELKNRGRPLSGSFVKTTLGLFSLGLTPFLITLLWGKDISSLLLGESWASSGTYAAILSFWLFSDFIVSPSIAFLIITRKNRFRLYFQIFSFIAKISSLYIGFTINKEPAPTLLAFSLTSAAVNFALIAICFGVVKKIDRENFATI